MRRNVYVRLLCAGLALWFGLIACGLLNTTAVGNLTTSTQTVDLTSATSARVEITFPAGELNVAGGAQALMEGNFRYNVADWQPQVKYTESGSQGELVIRHSGNDLPVGDEVINQWDIRLNNGLPLDIHVENGAGISDLDLSALDLSTLRVEVGAGNTNLDLRGNWAHDVNATVDGGVGELTILLPADVGVRVNIDIGIGSITATGLEKDDQGYVNQAYGTAPNTLTLEINAGAGSIDLQAP